jgi:hypothetical protein
VQLELHFDDLDEDLEGFASVQVRDLGTAGTPPTPPTEVGPFAVTSAKPSALVDVPLTLDATAYEPGLVVRVRARAADGSPRQFLNTTATRLQPEHVGPVRVSLQRIG